MSTSAYHLAEINVARMVGPIDSPVMADFVAQLDEINTLAENSAGFVWRLKSDNGNATSIRLFDDEMIIINISVWESVDALHNYTYSSDHARVFRRRTDWFERMTTPYVVMWWIPAGHEPTPQEAKERLEHLHQHGPTPYAFTFKQRFTVEELLASEQV